MTVFAAHPYQTREKRKQLAVKNSGSLGQFFCLSSCLVKFQDRGAKAASGDSGVGVEEEPAHLPRQTVRCRPTLCWLLAGKFLEMAALAYDYSFRQYCCPFASSLTICIKGRTSYGPKENNDTCQGCMFLTGVGRPSKIYLKNLFLLANFNTLGPPPQPFSNAQPPWMPGYLGENYTIALPIMGCKFPISIILVNSQSFSSPYSQPIPTPWENVPCIFLAPCLYSH